MLLFGTVFKLTRYPFFLTSARDEIRIMIRTLLLRAWLDPEQCCSPPDTRSSLAGPQAIDSHFQKRRKPMSIQISKPSQFRPVLQHLEERLAPALGAGILGIPSSALLLTGGLDRIGTLTSAVVGQEAMPGASLPELSAHLTPLVTSAIKDGVPPAPGPSLSDVAKPLVSMVQQTPVEQTRAVSSIVQTSPVEILAMASTRTVVNAQLITRPSSVPSLQAGQAPGTAGQVLSGRAAELSLGESEARGSGLDGSFDRTALDPDAVADFAMDVGDVGLGNETASDMGGLGTVSDLAPEPEIPTMSAALVVNRLEAMVTQVARQLADTVNSQLGWLGTVNPSVWLLAAAFIFLSHEYRTRRRNLFSWPDAGTPWSTALADVVPTL
jgi:hypothetical protein